LLHFDAEKLAGCCTNAVLKSLLQFGQSHRKAESITVFGFLCLFVGKDRSGTIA
jgi:hypothetical protein